MVPELLIAIIYLLAIFWEFSRARNLTPLIVVATALLIQTLF